jgi:carboxyl-terminal processing protease
MNTPKVSRPLTLASIISDKAEVNDLWKEINAFDTKNNKLIIHNCRLNIYLLTINPTEKANNEFQLQDLRKNHYLNEAIAIIDELKSTK